MLDTVPDEEGGESKIMVLDTRPQEEISQKKVMLFEPVTPSPIESIQVQSPQVPSQVLMNCYNYTYL